MQIELNKTVTYEVAKVDVAFIRISRDPKDNMVFTIPFRWLDAAGEELRRASLRYPATDIAASLGEQGQALMGAIASLFSDGDRPFVDIRFSRENVPSVAAMHVAVVDGEQQIVTKKYSAEELQGRGLSPEVITAVVSQLAASLT